MRGWNLSISAIMYCPHKLAISRFSLFLTALIAGRAFTLSTRELVSPDLAADKVGLNDL